MSEKKYTNLLYSFLKKFKVNKGDKHTHFSMGNPWGSFNIVSEDNLNLFKLYYENSIKENTTLHILEKHKNNYGPIIVDIDIKYNNDERVYKKNDILCVIKNYNKIISKYLKIDLETNYSFVCEKNNPSISNGDTYKDGFHIMYPNIWVNFDLQYIIRDEVVKIFEKNNYFEHLNILNDYYDIFDIKVIEDNGWFLYGSGKPNSDKYNLTNIYNFKLEKYDINNVINNSSLIDVLSIRSRNKDDLSQLNNNYTQSKIEKIYKTLERKNKKKKNKKKKVNNKLYNENDINNARKLIKMLSMDRADDYGMWIELGFCLFNIDHSLLDNWAEFSSMSPKFQLGDCEKRWNKFTNNGNGLGLGTLYRWVKEDNPQAYSKFQRDNELYHLTHSLSGTSGNMADAFYNINKGKYICASIKNSAWYEFTNHRWKSIEEGYTIYNLLNEVYSKKYKKVGDYFYNKSQNSEDIEKKINEEKREKALKLSEKLTTDSFKKKVISELKNKFKDENFYQNLDENKNLLCFTNGIYDLEKDEFRDGYPEDYISLCTNIPYQQYDPNNQQVKEVCEFFNQVQEETDMYNYVLDFFASCIAGHTRDELFHIWTGSGGNGKSISINLFQESLGDYATTISITLLTNKRGASSQASPEMVRTKGKRFVVFQEPENHDRIHVGHMKELTGNDKISARALFKEPIEFYPQFKTVLTCNRLPVIPSNDGGTWRRLRVIPWEMKFVDNPTEPYERKKDKTLKDKLPEWKSALVSILIERYKKYKQRGLIEPNKIKEVSLEYQRRSDIYQDFITEHIELKEVTNKNRLKLTVIYSEFKYWWKEAHTERQMPSRNEFKENFEEKFGRMRSYGWKMMKFKEKDKKDKIVESESEEEYIANNNTI